MKLPSIEGAIITIKFDQKAAKKCYENSLKTKRGVCSVTSQPQRREGVTRAEMAREWRPEPAGEVLEREIEGKKSLGQETQDQIAEVITRHLDAFAWSASDMPGIDPDFLCHRLMMDPKVWPVRQRRSDGRGTSTSPSTSPTNRRSGPITRAMAKKVQEDWNIATDGRETSQYMFKAVITLV